MTAARHRPAIPASVHPPVGPELKGKAPQGMWWVAWRQHRLQIAVTLGLIAVVIAALITFREAVIARFAAAGCDLTANSCTDPSGGDLWWNSGFSTWSSPLRAAMIIGPIVLGVFAGGPIFTREFARDTHVFALTQSVSRRRWWATKVIVAGAPLLIGLLALGFVSGWVDGTTGYTAHNGLGLNQFMTRAIIPAAHGLVAFAIAVGAGIVTRSTVATLVAGLIVAGLVVAGMATIYPLVLPATRNVTPFEAELQDNGTESPLTRDPDIRYLGSGYIDSQGGTISAWEFNPCFEIADNAAHKAVGLPEIGDTTVSVSGGAAGAAAASPDNHRDTPEYQDAYDRAMLDCAQSKGIVSQYTDYLPGSMLWPLRWAMTGIAAIIAALFLILGATRLRAAVAKR